MADELDPTINMLLTKFPEFFRLSAGISGHASSSSAQASAAQPETSQLKPSQLSGPRDAIALDDTANTSNTGVDNIGASEQALLGESTVPGEPAESEVSDWCKGGRPYSRDDSPMADFDGFEFDHDSGTEAATPSKSKEGKAEPSLSELMKLAEKYDESSDKENQQSLSDLLLELPASSNESPAKRSISPPLEHALARRASIRSYKKPTASRLRNEIHRSPADDDKLAQTEGKEPHWVEKRVDVAKVDATAASAHLLTQSKAHKEGATEEKRGQKGVEPTRWFQATSLIGPVNKDSPLPPVLLMEAAPGSYKLNIPTSYFGPNRPPDLRLGGSGVGLSADEWVKVPNEFRNYHPVTLAEFWDFACNPVIRQTVHDYKRNLALAGEADKVLDWPNKLLAALVDIKEAEIQKGAEHIVDTRDVKSSEPRMSISSIPKGSTELSDRVSAVLEIQKGLADPSYDTTTPCERFVLSKGVKLDSQLMEILTKFYKELQTFHNSSKRPPTLSDRENIMLEKLTLLEPKAFGRGNVEESELTVEDATNGKLEGKKGEMLAEGSDMVGGKGKNNELPLEDTKTGKGKGKDSDVLVNDPAIGKGEGKHDDLPAKDTTMGNGKGKGRKKRKGKGKGKGKERESELLVESPATDKGKGRENDLPLVDTMVSEGEEKEDDDHEAMKRKIVTEVFNTLKALYVDVDPNSEEFRKHLPLQVISDEPLTREEKNAELAYNGTYNIMEWFIRPQTATAVHRRLICGLLADRGFFASLIPAIPELQWNR